jgi:carbonic anhydrase
MERLVRGLINFKDGVAPTLRPLLRELAHGQAPELLLFTCSDSRVVPHLITSEEPGEVFVVRSVGNIVAPAGADGRSVGDVSEASAIEYALEVLGIRDIAVCGHSNCGAMGAVLKGRHAYASAAPNLVDWLAHAEPARAWLSRPELTFDAALPEAERLSQANVLQQLEHVASFAPVQRRRAEVRLHGLWFDIAHALVHLYEPARRRFVALDEAELRRLLTEAAAPVSG